VIRKKIKEDLNLLQKQQEWLEFSMRECKNIGIKENYNPKELVEFEALCSRYARLIDFLVRKIFRTIDEFEFENQGTLIDTINRAHKRGIIEDIEYFRQMKDLRNTISHEYVDIYLQDSFEETLVFSDELTKICNKTKNYIKEII
jgi:uncharacterized protein YutE (UPF0331/DUF86 family)